MFRLVDRFGHRELSIGYPTESISVVSLIADSSLLIAIAKLRVIKK